MRQTDNRMNHRVSEPQRSYGRIVRPRRQNKRGLLGFLLPFILLLAFFAGRSDDSYLEELCRVNHIDRNTRLYPGCFLTVLEAVEE